MNKVTTINLNGKAYQLEEAGFETLHAYLTEARTKLDGNPDQEEIMKDFEQAIAEKCDGYLSAHKNVITAAEIATIIANMGPVDADKKDTAEKTVHATKRLYRVREGAWIAGVCNGIAQYFDIDVKIVRIIFIVLALFTKGGIIGLYVLMAFFVPAADTTEERAFARGKAFNAHEFIEEMKRKYGKYGGKYGEEGYWKKYAEKYTEGERQYWGKFSNGWLKFTRLGTGIFTFIGSIALVGVAIAYSVFMWSIVVNGNIYDSSIFVGVSPVMLGLFVTAVAYVVMWPIRKMVNEARYHTWNLQKPKKHPVAKIISVLAWFIALGFVVTVTALSVPHSHKTYKPYGTQFWIAHHYLCIGGNYFCNPAEGINAADVSVINNTVEGFGRTLRMVSLLAPAETLKPEMDKVYGPYLTPELLAQWEKHPETALGREVSSPYPDHIDRESTIKNADGTYTVQGEVIEMTSDNKEHGGYTDQYGVSITLVHTDTWRISAVTKGKYQ